MKKYFLSFSFVLIIFGSQVLAATTTTLTSYFPPPVGAYNKLKLSPTGTLPACNAENVWTIYADSNGSLHVCVSTGPSTYQYETYPQECYNAFCSYDLSTGTPCTPTCPAGSSFNPVPNSSQLAYADTFQTSPHTMVISMPCCSYLPNACGLLPANATACPGTPAPSTNDAPYTIVSSCSSSSGIACTATIP